MHIINGEQWLNRKEAAAFTGYSAKTLSVYDCRKKFDFQPKKIGGRVHYKKSILTEHLFKELGEEICHEH